MLNYTANVGLVEAFSTGGPFTVFAPDNKAFRDFFKDIAGKLPPTVEELKKVNSTFYICLNQRS